jgi:hypothetical protein
MMTVDERKAAEELALAVQTLRNWRHLRKGPPYIRLGRSIRYRIDDLRKYMEENRIAPESNRKVDCRGIL